MLWGSESNCWQIGHSCESCPAWCSSHKRCMNSRACVASSEKSSVAVNISIVLVVLLITDVPMRTPDTNLLIAPVAAVSQNQPVRLSPLKPTRRAYSLSCRSPCRQSADDTDARCICLQARNTGFFLRQTPYAPGRIRPYFPVFDTPLPY